MVTAPRFDEQELQLPTYVEPPAPDGAIVSEVEGMPMIITDPITEYFTSVDETPGSGEEVTTFQVLWAAPPRPLSPCATGRGPG